MSSRDKIVISTDGNPQNHKFKTSSHSHPELVDLLKKFLQNYSNCDVPHLEEEAHEFVKFLKRKRRQSELHNHDQKVHRSTASPYAVSSTRKRNRQLERAPVATSLHEPLRKFSRVDVATSSATSPSLDSHVVRPTAKSPPPHSQSADDRSKPLRIKNRNARAVARQPALFPYFIV
ncbi:unnamed protein product [Caenorhabditis auriculariae]|uniref:Uncharacterized protein n=1 Tax=Caenorhabditis auriculariae TaxID=2777116 RepID=A0A8S1HUD7_9PELO|nr:unnamed protein product [Caenorhabditis auriculariae]